MENIVILGSGVAGLTAALYAARDNLNPVVLSGNAPGGQLMLTTKVENYPGFPDGIMGPELIDKMKKQAEKFGAKFLGENAKKVEAGDTIKIETSSQTIEAKSLIVATGARARWLDLENESNLRGRGVHTCATCDGFFYKDKEIIVVGGGDTSCEEADFLTRFASKVYLVHRRDELRACQIMQKRVFDNPKIEVILDSVVDGYNGTEKLESVNIKNVKTNEVKEMRIDGVFLAIGYDPDTEVLKGIIDLDEKGFVIADKLMHTSRKGIFAAGDVQNPDVKQAIAAAGSGCIAAVEASRYLKEY